MGFGVEEIKFQGDVRPEKNLGRQAYHSCPQPVYGGVNPPKTSEAIFGHVSDFLVNDNI